VLLKHEVGSYLFKKKKKRKKTQAGKGEPELCCIGLIPYTEAAAVVTHPSAAC